MREILNSKIIAKIASKAPVTCGHQPLLDALSARYPHETFSLVSTRNFSQDGRIVDSVGSEIARSFHEWIKEQTGGEDSRAQAVWEQYKDTGYIKTEFKLDYLYITVSIGDKPEDFWQIEIEHVTETPDAMLLGEPCYPVSDVYDLVQSFEYPTTLDTLTLPPFYKLNKLINMRAFVQELIKVDRADRLAKLPEMEQRVIRTIYHGDSNYEEVVPFLERHPDWLTRLTSFELIFQDWANSSAGKQGHKFCNNWVLQTWDYEDSNGDRRMGFTPVWADLHDSLNLPELVIADDTPPILLASKLTGFDSLIGFSFAWFFYHIHGNRIVGCRIAKILVKGIEAGILSYPDHDTEVLKRFVARSYGF